MADFAPPSGPPPPKVPEGWKAIWNAEYKEWFYVNVQTKKSQWDKPTEPAYATAEGGSSSGDAPPAYDRNTSKATGPEKNLLGAGGLGSNRAFSQSHEDIADDERLARQLQQEENARGGGSTVDRGEADSYYSGAGPAGGATLNSQAELPPRPDQDRGSKGKGLLGKLFHKDRPTQQQQYYQQPHGQYGAPGYPPGYPPQQGYYPQQQGYGGYGPPQAGYGGRTGGGLGTGGAAALGVGGGLLGGVLLADAFDGGDGGGDGGGYGGDDGGGGGDYGGGDGGGGDF